MPTRTGQTRTWRTMLGALFVGSLVCAAGLRIVLGTSKAQDSAVTVEAGGEDGDAAEGSATTELGDQFDQSDPLVGSPSDAPITETGPTLGPNEALSVSSASVPIVLPNGSLSLEAPPDDRPAASPASTAAESDSRAGAAAEEAEFDPEGLGPLDLITFLHRPPPIDPDRVRYRRRLEAGGAISAGNSDERDAHLRARVERSSPLSRLQLNVGGNYGESNGERSTNNWFSRANVDFHLDPHWILFFNNKFEYDEFENLDLRASLAGGLGYRFFDEPDRRLVVRLGPGVTFNLYSHPVNREVVPEMLGEVELRWPIGEWAFLDHSLQVHPGLEDTRTIRLSSDTSLEVPFAGNWSWSVGLRHDYNNQPNPGRERSDYVGYVGILYED